MPRTLCPHCTASISYPAEMAGKPGRCPKCKTAFTIPAGTPAGQPWWAEAVAQAPPPPPAPAPVAQVAPPPPVAKVALPVAQAVEDVEVVEEPRRPRRRRQEERPWYSVKVGGVLGGLGLAILILIGIAVLNKSGPKVFGPSKSTVEAEAKRVMNTNGISVTSIDLIEEGGNKYTGIARGTSGEYKVNVTYDGDKILVEYRPNLNWP